MACRYGPTGSEPCRDCNELPRRADLGNLCTACFSERTGREAPEEDLY